MEIETGRAHKSALLVSNVANSLIEHMIGYNLNRFNGYGLTVISPASTGVV